VVNDFLVESSNLIKKNMLRETSDKLPEVTDEMWNKVLEDHRLLTKEYLEVNSQLSPKTSKQYLSGLRQWFYFVYKSLNNKHISEITKGIF
jgi:hypothetical protein